MNLTIEDAQYAIARGFNELVVANKIDLTEIESKVKIKVKFGELSVKIPTDLKAMVGWLKVLPEERSNNAEIEKVQAEMKGTFEFVCEALISLRKLNLEKINVATSNIIDEMIKIKMKVKVKVKGKSKDKEKEKGKEK